MSSTITARGARHQLRVKHRLLLKPFYFTFDTDAEARSYGDQLDALLARGIIPAELLADKPKDSADQLLHDVVRAYTLQAPLTDSDSELLDHMHAELAGLRLSGLSYQWVDHYVRNLKLKRRLAPGTIRKRIGVLGRILDWHLRRAAPAGQMAPANPFRLLPKGYSTCSRAEASQLEQQGLPVRRDVARDRRLAPGEEERVLQALAGVKRDDRERALDVDEQMTMLYHLIVNTGLRLREAYRLRVDQIDLVRRIIHVEGSKGHRGQIKPRTVPIERTLVEKLRVYSRHRVGLLFAFWDGDPSQRSLRLATGRLSARFRVLFDYAGVANLTEHDLRHEATCRWATMRDARGGWRFSDLEVCRIMGWSSSDMMLRYASLRGEDLAARMV